jgi:steroid 5-alpha reductase family enzyme
MGFKDQHSPSIAAKVLLSGSILAGIMVAVIQPSEDNTYRTAIYTICALIYFSRFTLAAFIFMQRKIGWFEGGLVSFLFFMMFYLFGTSARGHAEPINLLDISGAFLFLAGSYINTLADYQRFAWKKKEENNGRLFTQGLFRYSMHINYFGDGVSYLGLAMITQEWTPLLVATGIVANFIVLQIPMLDSHLLKKYPDEFEEYARRTKKLIPFVY